MDIVFHAHHAVITDELRMRAERAVHKAAARLPRAVEATVRFEEDGPLRRVEIVLHTPRHRPVVAVGEARLLGPALTVASARLQAQVAKSDAPRTRARRAVTNGTVTNGAATDDPTAEPLDELALLEAAQTDFPAETLEAADTGEADHRSNGSSAQLPANGT